MIKNVALNVQIRPIFDFNGEAVLSSGYTVGYLEQEPLVDESRTVKEIVEEGAQETVDLLKEFEEINEAFADPDSAEKARQAEARAEKEKAGKAPAKRRSTRQSPTEAAVKSFLRSMSTTLGREIMRGILGVIKKS